MPKHLKQLHLNYNDYFKFKETLRFLRYNLEVLVMCLPDAKQVRGKTSEF